MSSGLPAADWYQDPDDPRQLRYWDGELWTDHYAARASPGGLRDIGDWLGDTFSTAIKRVGPIIGINAALIFPTAVVFALVAAWAVWPIRFTGISDDPTAEFSVDGISAARLAVLAVVWLLSLVVYATWSNALNHQLYWAHRGQFFGWMDSLQAGFKRAPRTLMWAVISLLGAFVIMTVAIIIAAIVGALTLGIGLLLVVPLLLLGGVLLWTRLAFIPVALAVAPVSTNPISVSLASTKGRLWPLTGRWVVWFIIAWILTAVLSAMQGLLTPLIVGDEVARVEFVSETADGEIGALLIDGVETDTFAATQFFSSAVSLGLTLFGLFVVTSFAQIIGQSLTTSASTGLYYDLDGPADETARSAGASGSSVA